jgi:spore coat-associated protein N
MSRLAFVFHRPRRALAALATVLAAGGLTVASGADFTAQSANPANTFSTGTLTMSNSADNAAILSMSGMRPNDTKEGTVDIKNTGSLSGAFTLSRTAPVDSDSSNPMSAKLNLTVVDCGTFTGATPPTCGDGDDATKYNGTLAAMGSTALGTYNASVKHRYQFTVQLDGTAGNAYQGDSSSVQFDFNAA